MPSILDEPETGLAWNSPPQSPSAAHRVLDAILGVALAGASHALLRTIGSRLALEPLGWLAAFMMDVGLQRDNGARAEMR